MKRLEVTFEQLRAVLARIAASPVAMEPTRFEALMASVTGPGAWFFDDYDDEEKEQYEVREGVAIVDVNGVLMNGAVSAIEKLFGLRSYDEIAENFLAAVTDPAVKAVVLRVDSPGGSAVGPGELAEQIFSARSLKPVFALASGLCASAAYHVGSAAEKLYTTRESMVGSVGVYNVHVDQTAAAAMAGVKVSLIHAGARKVDTSRFRPLDEAARGSMQSEVDALYEVFTAAVAKYRGLDQAKVKGTEARVFIGADAVQAGLANGVRSMSSVLAEIGQRATPRGAGRSAVSGGLGAAVNPPARPASGGSMDLEQALAALEAAKKKMAELEKQLSAAQTDNLELQARIKGLEASQKAAIIEKHVRAGRVTPAQRADVELLAERLDGEQLDARLSKWAQVTRPTPTGTSAGAEEVAEEAPITKLNAKAREIQAANPKLTFAVAFEQACKAMPDVYASHREAYKRESAAIAAKKGGR